SLALLEEALRLNELAESCYTEDNVPPVLWQHRAEFLARLARPAEAQHLRAQADSQPLRSARDHYLKAREYTIEGHFREALPLLQKATDLDPNNYWAWFLTGICHDDQGADVQAVSCYTIGIALMPDFHAGYHNRGLAYLRHNDFAH